VLLGSGDTFSKPPVFGGCGIGACAFGSGGCGESTGFSVGVGLAGIFGCGGDEVGTGVGGVVGSGISGLDGSVPPPGVCGVTPVGFCPWSSGVSANLDLPKNNETWAASLLFRLTIYSNFVKL